MTPVAACPRKHRIAAAAAAFLLWLVTAVAAQESAVRAGSFFVAPAGKDDADCRREAPCATLTRVVDTALPGDTVTVVARGDTAWLRRTLQDAARHSTRYGGLLASGTTMARERRGYIRLATTWATDLSPDFPAAARALPNLARALNAWTGVTAVVGPPLVLGTRDVERAPFLYLTSERAFELTDDEVAALGDYLRGGGFVLADNASAHLFEHGQAEAAMRATFRRALGRQGRLSRVRQSHPIYRTLYEFSGPPPGLDEARPRQFLEGIILDGRLAVLFVDKGYVHAWALTHGNEAQLRFGINAVVYALTDPGDSRRLHLRVER